jgi:hypothetical protein
MTSARRASAAKPNAAKYLSSQLGEQRRGIDATLSARERPEKARCVLLGAQEMRRFSQAAKIRGRKPSRLLGSGLT